MISKISVGVCMSKYAHTHPQRYLRKHDRVVGPKKNDNKSNKAGKTTAKRRKGEKAKNAKAATATIIISSANGAKASDNE